jgi:hypothetical protein
MEPVSSLDGYLLAPNHGFELNWHDGQFQLTARWWRKILPPRHIVHQVISEKVVVRWQHGEFAFESVPVRGKDKWLAQTKTVAHPAGSSKVYPAEERHLKVVGSSVPEVLAKIEEPMASALHEDEEWYRQLHIVSVERGT